MGKAVEEDGEVRWAVAVPVERGNGDNVVGNLFC